MRDRSPWCGGCWVRTNVGDAGRFTDRQAIRPWTRLNTQIRVSQGPYRDQTAATHRRGPLLTGHPNPDDRDLQAAHSRTRRVQFLIGGVDLNLGQVLAKNGVRRMPMSASTVARWWCRSSVGFPGMTCRPLSWTVGCPG